MKVNEIFTSVQGEGYFIGEVSVFLRLSGCDLDCEWCDTKYAQEEECEEWKVTNLSTELIQRCHEVGTDVIVVTGGEPMLQKDELSDLIELLSMRLKITIETHGGYPIPQQFVHNSSTFLSISPKLSNAGTDYNEKVFDKNIKMMNEHDFWNYQLKFVVSELSDIDEAISMMKRTLVPEYPTVVFQPKATPSDSREDLLEKQKELTDYILENKYPTYDVRVLPQLHKLVYGNERKR